MDKEWIKNGDIPAWNMTLETGLNDVARQSGTGDEIKLDVVRIE